MREAESLQENAKASHGADGSELELSRRDWLLLPIIGLATILAIILSFQWIAGRTFRQSATSTLNCLVLNDPSTGVRAIPNTVCSQKSYEGELVQYRFNRCGHRAGMECGPKLPGTYRIVMVGSSVNFGMWVPREKSFAALLPEKLSEQTGRRIELYNEAMQWGFPASTALRFHQVFQAQPDLILWVLTPTDVANPTLVLPYVPSQHPPEHESAKGSRLDRIRSAFRTNSLPGAFAYIWDRAFGAVWSRKIGDFRGSASGILLQHALYASQSQYVKSYLMGPDSEGGFLKAKPSAEWRGNLVDFDKDAAQIEGEARAVGVPVVAVLVPDRAQAAMLSMGQWPSGYDPYKLNSELRAVIESHGGTYIDILPYFRVIPAPEQNYFPVDGHPDAAGHKMISQMLAQGLTSGAVPTLNIAAQAQAVQRDK